jgi:sterol desaturase/sphingolipid hydroxylase (fatty acid hydroxylase superfamily)
VILEMLERMATSRAALQGLAMGLFLVVAVAIPRVKGQPMINRDTFINVATGALMFLASITVVKAISAHLAFGLIPVAWLPEGWMQFLFSFLALDFMRYWLHYADHRVPFLWKFHRVHHSSERLDATSGLRMHLVDFFQLTTLPLLLFTVLFDADALAPWVVPAAMGVGVVFDAFEHSNIRFDYGSPVLRAWGRLFNNPHFHSWHHTRDAVLCDGNYGNSLTIWDRLFGTDVTRPASPDALGLDPSQALDNTVLGLQLLRPRRGT